MERLASGKFQAQMQRGSRSIVHDWSKVQELLTTKHPTRQAHGAESTHGEKCLELEKMETLSCIMGRTMAKDYRD